MKTLNVFILFLALVSALGQATVVAPSSVTGKGSSSPLTTKGDLYTHSSTADARLAIGADGLVLVADSASANGVKWTAVAGTGDVVGPASATDNGVCRYDGTTGKAVQDSAATLSDNGNLTVTASSGDSITIGKTGDAPSFKFEGGANDWVQSIGVSGEFLLSNAAGDAAISVAQSTRKVSLASLSVGTAVINDGSGNLASSTTTSTQLGYLDIATGKTGTGTLVYSIAPTFTSSVTLSDSVAAGSLISAVQNTSTSGRSRFRAQGNDGDALVDYRNSAHSTSGVLLASQAVFRGSGPGGAAFGSENASGNVTFFSGGTASGNAFLTASSAGALTFNLLTASSVPVLNSSKVMVSSSVNQTELEYLDGLQGSLTVDEIDALIETPTAKTYTLRGKARYPGTLSKVYAVTSAGTLTANVKINGSSVTSCNAISVSSTPSDTTCTGANTFVAGDVIAVTVSSPSSAADLSLSLQIAR